MIDATYEQRLGAAAAQTIRDARSLASVAQAGNWNDARLAVAAATLLGLVLRQEDPAGAADRVDIIMDVIRHAATAPDQPTETH